MEPDQITFVSYFSGGVLFGLLTSLTLYMWRLKTTHSSLVLAALGSTLWHLSIAMNYQGYTLGKGNLLILETGRYALWIIAMLYSLKFSIVEALPEKLNKLTVTFCTVAFSAALLLKYSGHPLSENTLTVIWSGLIMAIAGFVAVEQLYKNASDLRLIKLWALVIGGIFIYDIYLFAYSLIFNQINLQLWQARGAVNGAAALLLLAGSPFLIANKQRAKLTLSRPVAFYTTSITVAGGFLALMAVSGYYVQLYGGNWGSVIQIVVLFVALVLVSTAFASSTIRARMRVVVNKNFFRHKYDYRMEWLRLINYLSRAADSQDFYLRAISAVASIFKSPRGILWVVQRERLVPVSTRNMDVPENYQHDSTAGPFYQALREHEWVYSNSAPANKKLHKLVRLLPPCLAQIPDLWLVLPLLTEQNLVGIMILTKPQHDSVLSWEDLDLLKTVGRQVASYIDRHQSAEQVAESKQLDAFNKLTAFVMHDLKNLIAQQALVVDNAVKHKDNPAFIEDAIKTIDNSVGRMSNLLRKLQRDETQNVIKLSLSKILVEATRKCGDTKPVPSLRLEDNDIRVNADPDTLVMIVTHIIKNAQEASDENGFVDVTLRREGDSATLIVEDNGEGMDTQFIRDRLFKPFVTTKSGKGMGIGVYQTNEFLKAMGGSMTVESTPGKGSCFTLSMPTL